MSLAPLDPCFLLAYFAQDIVRIAIDISSATPRRTGIGTYTYEMVRRIVRDPAHEFSLLFNSLRQPAPEFPELALPHVRLLRTRVPGPLLVKSWQHLGVPKIERFSGAVDLFHAPATYIPPQRAGTRVATVHDLYFGGKGETQWLGDRYLRWTAIHALPHVDGIIAVSSLTAQQVKALPWFDGRPRPPEIRVIPHGVDEIFLAPQSEARIAEVHSRYGLPDRYILHVGSTGARKNTGLVLAAHEAAVQLAPDLVPPLVLAGAEQTPMRSTRTIATGYVARDDLPALYAGASVLLLPSRMEGFGMPIIEALACGTPVIASPQTGALEFLPAETVVAAPGNAEALGATIARLLMDRTRLATLRDNGRAAVAHLTWDASARATLDFYQHLGSISASKRA